MLQVEIYQHMLPHGGAVAFSLTKAPNFLSTIYMWQQCHLCLANKETEEIVLAKNKHLTDAERLKIEQWLKDRVSINSWGALSQQLALRDIDCRNSLPFIS